MRRRANNEGTVRERENRKWEASIQLVGRRYWVRRNSEREVRLALAELKREHALGELVAPSRMTVAEHLAGWLDAGRDDWKPKTYEGYETVCRVYLVPAFGRFKLQALTAPMLTEWYARWRRDREVAGGTLLNVHRVLHRALKIAVRQGLVSRNVADNVEPPKVSRKRPVMLSPTETTRLQDAIDGSCFGPLWDVLLGTGCRMGEAFGLRWEDADLDAGVLNIERSLTWVGGRPVVTEPKTLSSRRRLTLPTFVTESLKACRVRQLEDRLSLGPQWLGEDRIITEPDGRAVTPSRALKELARVCESAGVRRIRIHDLRHLHASLALGAGVSLVDVSRRLGHANVGVTAAIYAHALRDDDSHVSEAVERALGG